jgi:hypothetical protein
MRLNLILMKIFHKLILKKQLKISNQYNKIIAKKIIISSIIKKIINTLQIVLLKK